MASLPTESPAQDIRNALTILSVNEQVQRDSEKITLDREDFAAVYSRLYAAVEKLEAPRRRRPARSR